mmetsp:Transcript_18278/g.17402  ORF Transcript_18278/g.17402 Transcript_18278/m.17402 type:complete len:254 (+) Transcript_18278:399-1160(+)
MFILFFEFSTDIYYIVIMLFLNTLAQAFVDVVVDALMVAQARKDPEKGSDELQSFAWALLAIGGILGSLMSAYFTMKFHPKYSFLIVSFVGVIMMGIGSTISIEVERAHIHLREEQNFLTEVKRNLREIKEALMMPQIYRTLLFFILAALVTPSFGTFFYYFALNVLNMTKATLSLLGVLAFFYLFLATFIYTKFFSETEIRQLFKYAIYLGYIGVTFTFLLVMRVNIMLGINDIVFIVFTSFLTDTLSWAFT